VNFTFRLGPGLNRSKRQGGETLFVNAEAALGLYPIVTLEKQLPNMIGKLV
jgi:hypothetical protein